MKTFLTGLGIGVGLGVLFAAETGEATRRKFGARLREWSESLSQCAENVYTAARRAGDRVSEAAGNASEKGFDLPPKKLLIGSRRLPRGMSSSIPWDAKN
jgi:gas vesicle protein